MACWTSLAAALSLGLLVAFPVPAFRALAASPPDAAPSEETSPPAKPTIRSEIYRGRQAALACWEEANGSTSALLDCVRGRMKSDSEPGAIVNAFRLGLYSDALYWVGWFYLVREAQASQRAAPETSATGGEATKQAPDRAGKPAEASSDRGVSDEDLCEALGHSDMCADLSEAWTRSSPSMPPPPSEPAAPAEPPRAPAPAEWEQLKVDAGAVGLSAPLALKCGYNHKFLQDSFRADISRFVLSKEQSDQVFDLYADGLGLAASLTQGLSGPVPAALCNKAISLMSHALVATRYVGR